MIIYPSSASPDAVAYFVGHEMGHQLILFAGHVLSRQAEERAASRIASALILPGRAFQRDLRSLGADLAALRDLWPLASPWVLARRICEVIPSASAAAFSAAGRCLRRVGDGHLEASDAVQVGGKLIAVRLE